MKKITYLLVLFFFVAKIQAQTPQGIPYQAVARDNAGNLIKNQNIALRFSIHDGTANGAVVFTETHSVTTDALGLFAVNIGGGTSSGTLADVNWGSGAKFTQLELDVTGGSNFIDMGTTQMMSVPYALYAGSSGNSSGVSTGAIGQTSSNNGATITSGVLSLTPADATNGGIVTAGAQTFGGVKTFSSGIVGDLTGNATSATKTAVTASVSTSTFYPSFVNATSGTQLDHYANSGLTFNPGTGNLTATTFTGNLLGGANEALIARSVNIYNGNFGTGANNNTVYPAFVSIVPGTNGFSNPSALPLGMNDQFKYNPSTGNLTAPSFTGNLTGNVTGNASSASTATITTSTSTIPQYIPFVVGASGNQGLSSNSQLRFYPYTGELFATSFTGNLTGNVTGNASSASTATITTSTAAIPQYLPFVAGVSGNHGLSSNNQLRFYPNTGELNATSFRGNVIGNATSATNLAGGAAGAIPYQSSVGTTSFTAAGTVGQVLTSNGTSSAPSWTTPSSGSSATNGYPFMPIQNAVSTLTSGTKSYWYIVRLTRDTTISGIQLYLSAGNDPMRCGIYRGYLQSGVSGSITLVGQTTNTAMSSGLPDMRKPITATAGQSLTFAAGEYMTIAFHSSGSTAVYYQSSPLAAGNTHLMYSSTTNYVAAGFPATLTQTSISAAIVNKVCFELY